VIVFVGFCSVDGLPDIICFNDGLRLKHEPNLKGTYVKNKLLPKRKQTTCKRDWLIGIAYSDSKSAASVFVLILNLNLSVSPLESVAL